MLWLNLIRKNHSDHWLRTLKVWYWLLDRQIYEKVLRINMKFRCHHFYCLGFTFCCFLLLAFLLLSVSYSFHKKIELEWGQWVPQGLESSAMSCIQHQILRNHIWEFTIILTFEPLTHQGASIIYMKLLALGPREYG